MKFRSVFDIIGPIMVGPSSSHTAGAVRIGLFARYLLDKEPDKIRITFYGSFKETYRGHGTDIAIIGGILGYNTEDARIRTSLDIAKEKNIDFKFIESDIEHIHPNTAKVVIESKGQIIDLIGKSIGGGKVVIFEVLGFSVELSGDFPSTFIFFKEEALKNMEEFITTIKGIINLNYSSSVIEGDKLLYIETEQVLDKFLIDKISELPFVTKIKTANHL